MTLDAKTLEQIAATTLGHYQQSAEGFREGWNGERYGAYHDLEHWRAMLTAAGFAELEHYYRPAGLPRDQQPWLVSVWRKAL